MQTILLIAIGGGIGSALRYLTALFLSKFCSHWFPVATFAANIVGCFIIGIIIGLTAKHVLLHGNARALLVTGFCGGYTTFSTFALENMTLLQNGHLLQTALYTSLSIIFGIAAVWCGMAVTNG